MKALLHFVGLGALLGLAIAPLSATEQQTHATSADLPVVESSTYNRPYQNINAASPMTEEQHSSLACPSESEMAGNARAAGITQAEIEALQERHQQESGVGERRIISQTPEGEIIYESGGWSTMTLTSAGVVSCDSDPHTEQFFNSIDEEIKYFGGPLNNQSEINQADSGVASCPSPDEIANNAVSAGLTPNATNSQFDIEREQMSTVSSLSIVQAPDGEVLHETSSITIPPYGTVSCYSGPLREQDSSQ